MQFNELKLTPPLLRALKDAGYQRPSPIQEQAIPPVLERRDLLGCAQTGTGKTAAFALPILQLLNAQPARGAGKPIRALVITPTRELAAQIQESFTAYGRYLRLRSVVIFGGVGQQPQVDALKRGPDVLVATPGRLLDLIGQGYIKLNDLEFFVLDEADRMLDMGFIHDIRRVIKYLPDQRQTLFFSATMPPEIKELSATLLHDPVYVAVAPVSSTVDTIAQSVLFTDKNRKRDLLRWLLKDPAITSALVFTRTKHLADRVAKYLKQNGVMADSIHGDKSQGARLKALADFKSGRCRVLVATDIAARGIDINELSHVINFDLPDVPETYVHRIGRTGRAGLTGTAISFCTAEELGNLRDIESLIKKPVPVMEDHPYPPADGVPTVPVKAVKGGSKAAQPHSARQNSPKQQTRPKAPAQQAPAPKAAQVLKDVYFEDPPVLKPAPAKIYGSEEFRPLGRVIASGGSSKGKKQGGKAAQPQQEAKPQQKQQKKETPSGQARQQGQAQPRRADASAPKKPGGGAAGGRPRKNDRRREPLWIPSNNQPIVTRPQSYNSANSAATASIAADVPAQGHKPRRRRRRRSGPDSGGNTGGPTGAQG